MVKKITTLLALLLLLCLASSAYAAVALRLAHGAGSPPVITAYYVSPLGSDSNAGTLAAPFATLTKCQSAMQAASVTTCYIRAGTYSPAAITGCTFHSGTACGVSLTISDSGETFAEYPADGCTTAVINGATNSLHDIFSLLSGSNSPSNFTLNCLTMTGYTEEGFATQGVSGHSADAITLTNNIFTPANTNNDAAYTPGVTHLLFANNVVVGTGSMGLYVIDNGLSGGITGLTVKNNVFLNTCLITADCGAIYAQDLAGGSTGIKITNNYVRDPSGHNGIYLDDCVSNATVANNVVTGNFFDAVLLHGGGSDIISDNIFDAASNGAGASGAVTQGLMTFYIASGTCGGPGTGNIYRRNLMLSKGLGGGWSSNTTVANQPTIGGSSQENDFFGYGGTTPAHVPNTATNLTATDAGAQVFDPQLSGCYQLASNSLAYAAPVNFQGTIGGWGPPGYSIPPATGSSIASYASQTNPAGSCAGFAPSGYYVSTSGSDSNPGTLTSPFATLAKCQTAMQSGYKTCFARSGTFAPAASLVLGTNDVNESWFCYDGANGCIFSGANLPASTPTLQINAPGITWNGFKFTNNGFLHVAISGGSDNGSFVNNIVDGGQSHTVSAGVDTTGVGTVNNYQFSGNTIENLGVQAGDNQAGLYTNIPFTNSLFDSNIFECDVGFGIYMGNGGPNGDIFRNNQTILTGQAGGAPTCPTVINGAGTGVEFTGAGPNLIVGEIDNASQGYAIDCNGVTGSLTMPCYISDSNLHNNGDPTILINSAAGSVIRRSTLNSPGSIGVNIGEEHDHCPFRTGYSNNVLVLNNNITASLEAVYFTVAQNAVVQGNVGTIGTSTITGESPHYASGLTFTNWVADSHLDSGGNPCTPPANADGNSTSNLVQMNTFTSSNAAAKYGVLLELNQAPNTISHNILYPFGSPGTAAIQNNTTGALTVSDNQTSAGNAVTLAPPIAEAGMAQVVQSGATVTLRGDASKNFPSGTVTGLTYAWSQISNGAPTVSLSNASASTTSFTAPDVTQATILAFKLTVSNANGSSYDEVFVGVTPVPLTPPGYVVAATGGSDANAGTPAAPFATLAKCQTAMQTTSKKTCYLRAGSGGTYALGTGLTLATADINENWTYYPGDGAGTACLSQTSAFVFFTVNTGADGVSINGLCASGFKHDNHTSCSQGGDAVFVRAGAGAANNAGPARFFMANNKLSAMDCGFTGAEMSKPVLLNNTATDISYAAFNCNHCTGDTNQTTWSGNWAYRLNGGGTVGVNSYGFVFSTTVNGCSSNFTVDSNQVYDAATWEGFDNHCGTKIYWTNNLVVGAGNNTAYNAVGLSAGQQLNDIRFNNNIYDNGFNGTTFAVDAFIMCGNACGTSQWITGGQVENNTIRVGATNGCGIAVSTTVTVSGNNGVTPCNSGNGLDPETVSSIDFSGSASASFVANVANAVVATLTVHMSATTWSFPTSASTPSGPGVLSIGGTNRGGFVVCNGNQICQRPGGTPAGTYNDFSVIATLDGMDGSPATIASGTLTLTGS